MNDLLFDAAYHHHRREIEARSMTTKGGNEMKEYEVVAMMATILFASSPKRFAENPNAVETEITECVFQAHKILRDAASRNRVIGGNQ